MLIVAGPASAQQAPRINCDAPSSNVEITWCAEQDFNAADAKLNDAYAHALHYIDAVDTMPAEQRRQWAAELKEAQRRWIAFRDQDCGEVVGYEWFGGTGMTAAMFACKLQKTETRTQELVDRYPRS